MTKALKLTADINVNRLDSFVARQVPKLSRSQIQKLIIDGFITVNNRTARGSLKIKVGDRLSIIIPPPQEQPQPEEIPLNIIYEDNDLLIIDKPAGLTSHPAPGHRGGTLVNALLALFPDLPTAGDKLRPGIVHRLDKNTSGLMLVAKNNYALSNLIDQFKKRQVSKVYLVLVKGHLSPEIGLIEAPIGRHQRQRQKMAIVSQGKAALTEYRVAKYLEGFTLLEVMPQTGRTHQIRVHLAAIGYPVLGDTTYGIKSPYLKRQFIHAHRLGFKLPSSGKQVLFTSPLPTDLKKGLEYLT
jgi:23S rRNA pseudouridine1911/1915/1917 synthase